MVFSARNLQTVTKNSDINLHNGHRFFRMCAFSTPYLPRGRECDPSFVDSGDRTSNQAQKLAQNSLVGSAAVMVQTQAGEWGCVPGANAGSVKFETHHARWALRGQSRGLGADSRKGRRLQHSRAHWLAIRDTSHPPNHNMKGGASVPKIRLISQ
jgi:hypothetical protein